MNFYKLSPKHKKWFVFNKIIILTSLIISFILSLQIEKIEIKTNVQGLSVGVSFIISFIFLILAVFNRIGSIFKIRSIGFIFIFLFVVFLDQILGVLKWTIGLSLIPLLIDDIILLPLWNNLWYNYYDK